MVDIAQQINSVERAVATNPGDERVVKLSQTYDSPVGDVWDALTNPDRIPRWFLPVSGDLKVNGHYQLENNAGGTIDHCDPPASFGATWEYGDSKTRIDVSLSSVSDGRTRVELAHTAPGDAERWAEYGPGEVGIGWDMTFMGLARHLSPTAEDDVEPSLFEGEQGKQFITQASERWGEASIAAGTDKAEAQAAADRTTAFYTGAGSE